MEVLQHAANEHSKDIIENISVKEKEQQIENYEEPSENHNFSGNSNQTEEIVSDKYRCTKCQEIVYKKDALKPATEDGQELCSLCTILHYYD